jgi:sugar/nucleoside kinase (ribokinase family)
VRALPPAGGYVEIESEVTLLGGEASNTANALHRWSQAVTLWCNPLGDGADGQTLVDLLRVRDLDPQPLAAASVTPVCEIYVTDDGERTMFGRGFAQLGNALTLEKIRWETGKWFTAEPNMGRIARDAVAEANTHDMKVYVMDFNREDEPMQPGNFWQSSTDWAGVKNNVQRNVEWVKVWVQKKRCFAILSDGPNGFVAGGFDGLREHPVRAYPPYPAAKVVDTTGAGDLFRAGMLYGLESGWELFRCLQFASAAGCLKCQYLGATTQVPTVQEIEDHLVAHSEVSRAYRSE